MIITTEVTMEAKDMARLNVEIPRDLWRRAKQRALDTDRSLKEVVIDALEATLGGGKTRKGGRDAR
jgi:hypothetical protein